MPFLTVFSVLLTNISQVHQCAHHESFYQADCSATAVSTRKDNVCLVWSDCRIQVGTSTVGSVHERLDQLFNRISKQYQSGHDSCGRSRSKPRAHCKSSNGMEFQAKVSRGTHPTVHSLWRKVVQSMPQSRSWHSYCHGDGSGQQCTIYRAVPNPKGFCTTGPSSRCSPNATRRTHKVPHEPRCSQEPTSGQSSYR
jgi:hypothetical protein